VNNGTTLKLTRMFGNPVTSTGSRQVYMGDIQGIQPHQIPDYRDRDGS